MKVAGLIAPVPGLWQPEYSGVHFMTLLSESEAAAATGQSRFTIKKHIKSGRLIPNNALIDSEELARVFGIPVTPPDRLDLPKTVDHGSETAVLRYRIAELEHSLEQERQRLQEVREERDFWYQQAGSEGRKAETLTNILENQEQSMRLIAGQAHRQIKHYLNPRDLVSIAAIGLVAAAIYWLFSQF